MLLLIAFSLLNKSDMKQQNKILQMYFFKLVNQRRCITANNWK